MFPRPVRSFAGRRAELDRALSRIDDEVLFLVYGVGGIGKSEFVVRLVDELRGAARWADARALHVPIRPGATPARVLAEILGALGSRRRARRDSAGQLAELARLLEVRPHLLFLDDVHHLPVAEVGEALGFLSRHVQNSRIFVASRREIALPRDAAPPVVTTLGPLDVEAAAQMIAALACNATAERPEPESIVRATHGSPFYIRRALFRSADPVEALDDLAELSPRARRALLVASVAHFCPPVASFPAESVRELSERFLVQIDDSRLVVHDLVREARLANETADELASAHADAAELCVEAIGSTPLSAIDAVNHLLAAGRFDAAFEVVERTYSVLAAAGAEHLLHDALERLRDELPAHRVRIDLFMARSLARASLFDEADRLLSRISGPLEEAEAAHHASLAGEIALHRGDGANAARSFERAASLAPDPGARFQARLRLATATTLAGEGARAREVLASAIGELAAPTARQRARHHLASTVSWLFDEQFERAAAIAHAARRELPEVGFEDFESSAALAEVGRLGDAQELAERTARLAEQAGLHGLAARALAQHALLSAEGLQGGLAHELADRALASRHIGPRSRAKAHCAHSRAHVIEGEIGRAREHLAYAREAVAELPAAQAAVHVEHAAAELVGGNLDRAVEIAERAIEQYRGRSRRFELAHARLVLAAAHLARGRRSDEVLAERTLEQARTLADQGRFRAIQVGCAILSAALARRTANGGEALPLLANALVELDPERGSIYAGTLLAAIDGGVVARAVPGVSALLAHLGFAEAVEAYIVDREGRRAASATVVARERTTRDLFVDEHRAVLVGRRGEVEIAGRPMVCAMLSALIQARGAPLSPDALYTRVWGVTEYHPLRHRSALYVGINRLRACLREIFPDQEMIERAGAGWRLVDSVDACVAVAVRSA